MGSLFGGPKVTSPAAAPPPAPMLADSNAVAGDQQAAASRMAGLYGGDGTILTGPSGTATTGATAGKKLLGA